MFLIIILGELTWVLKPRLTYFHYIRTKAMLKGRKYFFVINRGYYLKSGF